MICPNCQKEIPDTAKACGYCGHWLAAEKPSPEPADTPGPARRSLLWLWVGVGVVVVIMALALAYLLGRSNNVDTKATVAAALTAARQEAGSTPVATPTDQPPTSTPAATNTPEPPTNTPAKLSPTLKPTNTPPPPTDTPTPKPTNTPKPANTPRPTPIPTATIDADPTVYDNFNNPAFDEKWHTGLWDLETDAPVNQATQRDGVVVITQQGGTEKGTRLIARKYRDFTLDAPIFFEARLMLDPNQHSGNTQLHLWSALSRGDWFAECGIYDGGSAYCFDFASQGEHYYEAEGIMVGYSQWHIFRIQVDPTTMTTSYYIDGQIVGSHIPTDADQLKKAKFTLKVGIWSSTAGPSTGYIDDVRIGPISQ